MKVNIKWKKKWKRKRISFGQFNIWRWISKNRRIDGIAYEQTGNIIYKLNKNDVIVKEYYYDGKLKFEGIYLNDKRWESKGYDKSNNIVYELKDGKGLIKEYNDYNKLIFGVNF